MDDGRTWGHNEMLWLTSFSLLDEGISVLNHEI